MAFFISLSRTIEQKGKNPTAATVLWRSTCAGQCRTTSNMPNIANAPPYSPGRPDLCPLAVSIDDPRQLLEKAKDGTIYSALATPARREAL
jgi:hypothetical protein